MLSNLNNEIFIQRSPSSLIKSIRIVENEVNQMNLAGSSSSLFGQNNSGQGNNAGPQSPTGITDSNRELRRR